MKIGQKIRKVRLSKKLSQVEAARRAGITYQKWNAYELGREPGMTIDTLRKIAAALGVKPGDLL